MKNYLLIARALAKETKLDDCYTTTAPTIQLQSLAGYVLRWCYNILAALQESYDCDFAACLSSFQAVMPGPFNVVHLINSRFRLSKLGNLGAREEGPASYPTSCRLTLRSFLRFVGLASFPLTPQFRSEYGH